MLSVADRPQRRRNWRDDIVLRQQNLGPDIVDFDKANACGVVQARK